MGLGSLSTHTAEAQDERAADASSAADGSDNDGNEGGKGARSSSSSAASKAQGALSSLIYGTKEGRLMDREIERSYSQVLARGKYVHSIVFHRVKPDKVDEYVELVGGWYPRMASMKENKVNLVGSWRTDVGDCDTFGMGRHLAPFLPPNPKKKKKRKHLSVSLPPLLLLLFPC